MTGSRIPKFYRFPVDRRLQILHERGYLTEADLAALRDGSYILNAARADRLTENVIGVFSLPMGLGLNFQINTRDYLVPMVVEEPSIIAAVSSAAKVVRRSGGFTSTADQPMLIGQIQVLDVEDPAQARAAILASTAEILGMANAKHPNMIARGGGATGVEVFLRGTTAAHGELIVVHLIVDSCDAMGANLVNSMCEAVAPIIERVSGGKVYLRILSNLTDRSLVRARAVIPVGRLQTRELAGEQVRDAVILANEFAELDPYRATTHNKGIMNGIDAVAIATGNDWRAIEAAAHAYAARSGHYAPLTSWTASETGDLVGELELPLKVGTVGGQVESNPAVGIANAIIGVSGAPELAEVMAAVGLAQNFAALKALSTDGIQHGHMRLHARSVAVAAGAVGDRFEEVVEKLIAGGEIKVWKAKRIMAALQGGPVAEPGAELAAAGADLTEPGAGWAPTDGAETEPAAARQSHAGYGKIILLGEHSVVYGRHAIAAPIGLAIRAEITQQEHGIELVVAGVEADTAVDLSQRVATLVVQRLGVADSGMRIEVFPGLPRANGLGASAALAVAVIRAVADRFQLPIDDKEVSALAFECERIVHGTPSGIDNTVATFGRPVLFRKTDAPSTPETSEIVTAHPIPVVIGLTGVRSLTAQTVGLVRSAWQRHPQRYESIFDQIDELVLAGVQALHDGDIAQLGDLMNINQGMLAALQVSSPELETLIGIARRAGALGAKLTGGGGGGAMIAVAEPDGVAPITQALRQAGFSTYLTEIR